jgi:hypothetical protein
MSKIQCFKCDKYGHFPRNCPTRKRGRQYYSTVDIDSDPPQRDEDMRDEDFFLWTFLGVPNVRLSMIVD